mmetsp:Transcript_10571/g.20384  ORF Transcript_10571/g.20384 Transcript_10571/m.20384 type:complete len:756 (-) Transcript_10571:31-2298(-)
MPKVVMCTAAEAAEMRSSLQALIANTDAKIEPAVQDASKQLRGELQQVAENVTRNAQTTQQAIERVTKDSKTYSDTCVEALTQRIAPLLKANEEKINKTNQALEGQIRKVDNDVRVALAEELGALCEQFDKQLTELRESLEAQSERWAKEAAQEVVKQRKESDEAVECARSEAKQANESTALSASKEVVASESRIKQQLVANEERSDRATGELQLQIDRLSDELKELQASAEERAEIVTRGALGEVHRLREDAEARFNSLSEQTTRMQDAVSQVENFSTRRVDWVINKVSQRLRPSTPGSKTSLHTSWFSPKFNAAGAHGLQLEIQLFRPADPPFEEEAAGDCAAFLWACKGTSLVYKLYIGKKVAVMEKVFNGRVPYGTNRLCFLKDQINREDDTLLVSVEILESVREIESPVEPPPLPDDPDEAEVAVRPLEGAVVYHRHVNNRVYDQVKREVEIMRSRMVRRIEWRVEQAGLLRRCFPLGESLCSAPFSAAGIENMQLIFYPSGYGNCTEGFCSLFLFGPAGTTLRATLWAGSQRRDVSHYFEEPGAFGRTNFCRFDSAIDVEEDTVRIALEVEEAHQDVQATVAHPVVQPGDRRTQAQIGGDLPNKVESVVKLKRVPGKAAQGMSDQRVLPSLWQAKSLSSDPIPKGMHSFEELRPRGCRQRAGEPALPQPTSNSLKRRSESVPTFKNPHDSCHDDTQLGTDLVPLPQLSRTAHGSPEWGSLHSSIGLRTVRKARRDRSVGLSATAAAAAN